MSAEIKAKLIGNDSNIGPQNFSYEKSSAFEIKELIGVGSNGKVFRALHVPTRKHYALKIISKSRLRGHLYALKHLNMEMQIIRTLDHPFIAKCHGVIKTKSHIVIVEEFISGGELFHHIQKHALTEDQTVFYAAEIVVVLVYLKDMGVLFRDLKPENILLDSLGHIKLIDFGLATNMPPYSKNCAEKVVFTRTFCGTAEYLAPEVLDSQYYGLAVDIWALGCVIFECITGRPPFYNENQALMYNNINTGQVQIPDQFSEELKNLISSLLSKDWRIRPALEEIKAHPWFRGVNWEKMGRGEIRPPIVPNGIEKQCIRTNQS